MGGGWSTPRPGNQCKEARWASGPVWTGEENPACPYLDFSREVRVGTVPFKEHEYEFRNTKL
jgi:hypothetical protein